MLHTIFAYLLTSKSDRRAYLILVIICFLGIIINVSFKFWVQPPIIDQLIAKENYQTYLKNIEKQKDAYAENYDGLDKSNTSFQLSNFDPNTMTFKEAMQLGFDKKTFNIIDNYREAGGQFFKKTDLKKIYGMSASFYEKVAPYIKLPNKDKKQYANKKPDYKSKKSNKKYKNKEPNKVVEPYNFNPNTISKQELIGFGINKKAANNWEKFRAAGGAFNNISQVENIYNLSQSELERIKGFLQFPSVEKSQNTFSNKSINTKKPYPFNPNEISWEELVSFGIKEQTASTWLKFREFSPFYAIQDIEKIFGIQPETIDQLAPFMQFPEKPKLEQNEILEANEAKAIEIVELNTATIETLTTLPRVGEKRAKLIIKLREELGGFSHKNQLKEVFGISDEEYQQIERFLTLENTEITKININNADKHALVKHPYINYSIANSIVKMREQNGDYQSVDDIKRSKLIDKKLLQKIKPYLTL